MNRHTFPMIQKAYDRSVAGWLFVSRACMDSDKCLSAIKV